MFAPLLVYGAVEAFSLVMNAYGNTEAKRRFNKQNTIATQANAQAITAAADKLSDLSTFRAGRAGLGASKEVNQGRNLDIQNKTMALYEQNDNNYRLARENFSYNLDSELFKQLIGGLGSIAKQGVRDYTQYQLAQQARNSDSTIPIPGVTKKGRQYASQNKIIENGSSQHLVDTLQDEMYDYLEANTDFGAI
jgi:hypothetical protein